MTTQNITVSEEIYEQLHTLALNKNTSIEAMLAELVSNESSSESTVVHRPIHHATIADQVMHIIAEGVIVHDAQGKVIFANESAVQILGITVDQMNGDDPLPTHWRTIQEDGTPIPIEAYPATITLRTGKSLSNQILGIWHQDESLIWVSVNTKPALLTGDQPVVLVSFSDIRQQKMIEAELLNEQARMRSVLESIPGTIITVNQQCTVIDMYSQIALNEGLSYGQFIGKTLDNFLTKEVAQAGNNAFAEVFAKGKQTYYRIKSDTGRWYDIRVSPVLKDGEINAATMTSIEITEQVNAEEALRDSEAFLRAVLHSTPGSIITVDRDLSILSFHSTPARTQGINTDRYLGKHLLITIPEDSKDQTRSHVEQVFKTGQATSFEAVAFSGLWYIIHIAPTKFNENGDVSAVTLVSLDITELKQAEEALKQSEANLVAILESMPGAVYTVDHNGRILQVHSWMWNTRRRDPKDFRAEFMTELTPDEHLKDRIQEHIDNAIFKRTLTNSEIRGQDMRWYDVRSGPIIRDGEVSAVIFIALDIHDRKLLEQKALDVKLEKERVRVLYNFISDASHEFRTPLAAMNTALYLLDRDKDESKRAQRIAQIQKQIFSLTTLVNDLLTISRLDSNPQFKTHTVNIDGLVRQILQSYQQRLEDHHLDLNVELPSSSLEVIGNNDELGTALKKIIDNALRFTPDEGKIVIRGYREDTYAVIEVQDSGKGMTEDELERAPERFYRSDYSHTTRGFGLGLPIAVRIIEAHCGHLILQSKQEQGTTVIIRLPVNGCD
ncbi:MAG: PAS domain S-box protein, partial [Aggregatilineales bacterium]